jgi:hypothetical protein
VNLVLRFQSIKMQTLLLSESCLKISKRKNANAAFKKIEIVYDDL